MTRARLLTLMLVSGVGAGGFVIGTSTSSTITLRTTTAVSHALDLRQLPTEPLRLTAYGSVRDSLDQVHQLGATACPLDDAGTTAFGGVLRSDWAKKCAAGGADGGPVTGVHALDLRRRAEMLPDGGGAVFYSAQAYGYLALPDGGVHSMPGRECAKPPSLGWFFDKPGLECLLNEHFR